MAPASSNIGLVRSIYAAWGRGDFDASEWAHPDVEYVNPPGAIEPGTRRGAAAFNRAVEGVFEGWESWQMEPERLEVLGDGDHVSVVVRYEARGRASGAEVKGRESALWTVRDGKIARYEWFHEAGDAFQSARPELPVLAREALEAANRRDFDALLAYAARDVVYDTSPSGFGVYKGLPAIRDFIEGYWDAFEDLRFELEEFVDLGNGVTLAINRQHARPVGSTASMRAREAHVTEWQGGLVARITVYVDVEEARAAAERLAAQRG